MNYLITYFFQSYNKPETTDEPETTEGELYNWTLRLEIDEEDEDE